MISRIIALISIATIVIALALFSAGPGTRFGLWDYGVGLDLIRKLSLPVIIGAVLSAMAFIAALLRDRSQLVVSFLALVMGAVAAFIPLKMRSLAETHPFIHDITTDFDNPPQILAAADLPRNNPAAYVGAEQAPREAEGVTIAEAQRAAFPDIGPIMSVNSLENVRDAAREVIDEMGMEVLAEGPADQNTGGGWRIEAAFTSTWFGFVDDFVVRISPAAENQVIVDVRSKSRVGLSDLGANGARVRTFTEKLSDKLGE